MVAQDLAQGCLQEMGCRMVAGQIQMTCLMDGDGDGIACLKGAFFDSGDEVYQTVRQGLGIGDLSLPFFTGKGARIAELTAAFGVEGVVVDDDCHFFPG